jgi:PAS domain S-box-containing protein
MENGLNTNQPSPSTETTSAIVLATKESFHNIFKLSPYALALTRASDGKFIDVNEAFVSMTGYSKEDILAGSSVGLNLWANIEDRKWVISNLEKEGVVMHKEFNFLRKNGEIMVGIFAAQIFTINNERLVLSSIDDVTEKKRAEKLLHAFASRQEAILGAIPDIIMEVDNDKVYTWSNKPGYEFFGDDVIGKKADNYFEGDENVYGVVQPIFEGSNDTIYLRSWQRRKDGEKRLLSWRCRYIRDNKGEIIGAISSARDVTENVKAEETLKAKMMDMEKLNQLMIGRELAMVKLKEENEKLKKELAAK